MVKSGLLRCADSLCAVRLSPSPGAGSFREICAPASSLCAGWYLCRASSQATARVLPLGAPVWSGPFEGERAPGSEPLRAHTLLGACPAWPASLQLGNLAWSAQRGVRWWAGYSRLGEGSGPGTRHVVNQGACRHEEVARRADVRRVSGDALAGGSAGVGWAEEGGAGDGAEF